MSKRVSLVHGDITTLKVDAIVNAANASLLGGGGVDGAIHRAGGHEILEACKAIRARQGGCPTGQAVITTAGRLPAKYVVHTVGPIWTGDKKAEHSQLLADCYRNSLDVSFANNCKTIAFPNISTGVYRFPKTLAAEIAVRTVKDFLLENPSMDEVIFVCFDDENYQLYQKILAT
jgi:O-acetyl-ADP-ribose deacetylase (regulator of RNase III)